MNDDEARAWDDYFNAAFILCNVDDGDDDVKDVQRAVKIADLVLAERRKRFGSKRDPKLS